MPRRDPLPLAATSARGGGTLRGVRPVRKFDVAGEHPSGLAWQTGRMGLVDPPQPLDRSRFERAAAMLARAFDTDPLYRALFPEPDERRRLLSVLWGGVLRYSARYGVVLAAPDVVGVSAWLAPGAMRITARRQIRSRLALPRAMMRFPRDARRRTLACISYLDRLGDEVMGGRPCWYLWVLGVEPSARRRGIGSSLLTPILERADRGGLPSYLETFEERDVGFYERFGYRVVRSGAMPGEDLLVWTMIREPPRTPP